MDPSERDSSTLLDLMALMRSAEDRERTRIARVLHDNVLQQLAGFRMRCFGISSRMREAVPQMADEIEAILTILDGTISTIRELSDGLRPGILGLGIEAAIEWRAEQFEAQSEIACVVDIETDQVALAPDRAAELFRIFEDAISCGRLHPGVTTIDVTLRRDGDGILLEVRHDGMISSAEESGEHALRVLTMGERAHRVGGTLFMADSTIRIRMPLQT